MEDQEYTIDLMEVAEIISENRKPIAKITGVFIALAILYAWFFPFGHIDENTSTLEMTAWGAVYLFCVLVNFWLSYRLFCRQQVIGRFVNV